MTTLLYMAITVHGLANLVVFLFGQGHYLGWYFGFCIKETNRLALCIVDPYLFVDWACVYILRGDLVFLQLSLKDSLSEKQHLQMNVTFLKMR